MVLFKTKGTWELIGGHNLACWNLKEKSLDEEYCIETGKRFLFLRSFKIN